MATQGVLSIIGHGRVLAKAITGADGYKMVEIASAVRDKKIIEAKKLFELCREYGLGGDSFIVQYSPYEWLGDCEEDELPVLYSETFNEPRFNPRWKYGSADYVEIVDMTHALND